MKKIIGIAIVAIGAIICCIPFLLSACTQQGFDSVISSYDSYIKEQSKNDMKKDIADAEEYNEQVATGIIKDNNNNNYYNLLSYGDDGVMGYISVPSVNINLPIYHGTSDEILAKGAGHMENTSLPIGGKNTHTVISGHTGLSYKMFDGLHDVTLGDYFYITIQDKVLKYKITNILKTTPYDTKYIKIVKDKDLATLVTCHPYGFTNQRLLVQGERVLD